MDRHTSVRRPAAAGSAASSCVPNPRRRSRVYGRPVPPEPSAVQPRSTQYRRRASNGGSSEKYAVSRVVAPSSAALEPRGAAVDQKIRDRISVLSGNVDRDFGPRRGHLCRMTQRRSLPRNARGTRAPPQRLTRAWRCLLRRRDGAMVADCPPGCLGQCTGAHTRGVRAGARALGADMIELDVQLTRDEQLVVLHDHELERTTNGHGRGARPHPRRDQGVGCRKLVWSPVRRRDGPHLVGGPRARRYCGAVERRGEGSVARTGLCLRRV